MIVRKRKTLKERIEIVHFCIMNDFDYRETAKKYKVSYFRLISWVDSYEKEGESGLVRLFSNRDADSFICEIVKLKSSRKKLIKENFKLRGEIKFLRDFISSNDKVLYHIKVRC